MKSIANIIDADISRRLEELGNDREILKDLVELEKELFRLDSVCKEEETDIRIDLNSLYRELRHFSGKWPRVYESAEIERWPLVAGISDDDCNPYFPISRTRQSIGSGISPHFISTSAGSGIWSRDRAYAGATEPELRQQAIVALTLLHGVASSQDSTPSMNDVTKFKLWQCKPQLAAWKSKISRDLVPDLYNAEIETEKIFWQDLDSKIEAILASIPQSLDDNSLEKLRSQKIKDCIQYIITDVNSKISNRIKYLESRSEKREKEFFSIIKLRLTQSNGTLARLNDIRFQISVSRALIEDCLSSINTLNILKTRKA